MQKDHVSLLSLRPVWPALFCLIGAAPVILFYGYLAIVIFILDRQGPYFAYAIINLVGLLVPVVWVFLISLLLLLDGARKTIWGILAAATFGVGSIISFLAFAQILSGTPIGSGLALWLVGPVFAGPILGLVGAVWALLSKHGSQ